MDFVKIDGSVKSAPSSFFIIRLEINNTSTDPIGVRIKQPCLELVNSEHVDTSQSEHKDSWLKSENNIEFRHKIDWGKAVTTEYGLRNVSKKQIKKIFEETTVAVHDSEGNPLNSFTGVSVAFESDDDKTEQADPSAVRPEPQEKNGKTEDSLETEAEESTPESATEPDNSSDVLDADEETPERYHTSEPEGKELDLGLDEIATAQNPEAQPDLDAELSHTEGGASADTEATDSADSPNQSKTEPEDDLVTGQSDTQTPKNASESEPRESPDPSKQDKGTGSDAAQRQATNTTSRAIAVAGAKGGVGKTTSCINLGTGLANAGITTVIVEMDLAMANLVDFINANIDIESDPTFHDVLAGTRSLNEATYDIENNLSIVPSGTSLSGYSSTDLSHLSNVVSDLRDTFEVVLFDTPAGLSRETIRPIDLSDEVILISTPRVSAIRNTKNTMEVASRVGTPVRGLLLTKSGTGASPGAARIAEFLDVELLGHVPEDERIPHSQDKGQPVIENAPSSDAANAYQAIVEKLSVLEPTPIQPAEPAAGSINDVFGEQEDQEGVLTEEAQDHDAPVEGETTQSSTSRDDGSASNKSAHITKTLKETESQANGEPSVGGSEGNGNSRSAAPQANTDEETSEPGGNDPDERSDSSSFGQKVKSFFTI